MAVDRMDRARAMFTRALQVFRQALAFAVSDSQASFSFALETAFFSSAGRALWVLWIIVSLRE
jgi:hypothetical protein